MDKKKAGIIVAILCVLIAISFCACKSIKIKKKTTSDVNTSEVSSNTSDSNQQSSSAINTTDKSNSTVNNADDTKSTVSNKKSSNTVVNNNSDTSSTDKSQSSSSDSSFEEVNESSIDYSGDEEKSKGVVKTKKVYLYGNSLVHCVGIEFNATGGTQVIEYPCGYSGYSSLKENDVVTVKYKRVTNKTVAIVSVSK